MHVSIFSCLNSLVLKQNTSHRDVNMYVCQMSDDVFVYVSIVMFTVFSWIMKCTQLGLTLERAI